MQTCVSVPCICAFQGETVGLRHVYPSSFRQSISFVHTGMQSERALRGVMLVVPHPGGGRDKSTQTVEEGHGLALSPQQLGMVQAPLGWEVSQICSPCEGQSVDARQGPPSVAEQAGRRRKLATKHLHNFRCFCVHRS